MFDIDRIIGRGAIALGLLTAAGGLALVPELAGGDVQQGLTGLGCAGFGIGLAAAFFFIGRGRDRRASRRARWPGLPFRWEEDWETGAPLTSVDLEMARVIAVVLLSAAALAIVMAGEAMVQAANASGDEAEWSGKQRAAHSASLFMPVVAVGLSIAAAWAAHRRSKLGRLRVQLSPMPPVLGAPLWGAGIVWRGSAGDAEVVVRAVCVSEERRATLWEHEETLRFRPGSQSRATFSSDRAACRSHRPRELGPRGASARPRRRVPWPSPFPSRRTPSPRPHPARACPAGHLETDRHRRRGRRARSRAPSHVVRETRGPDRRERARASTFAEQESSRTPGCPRSSPRSPTLTRKRVARRPNGSSAFRRTISTTRLPRWPSPPKIPLLFVRGAALYTLMRAGPKASPAVPALIRVVSNPDLLDQDIAALALAKIGLPAAAPAIEPMRAAAAHAPRSDQREAISKALADLEGTP